MLREQKFGLLKQTKSKKKILKRKEMYILESVLRRQLATSFHEKRLLFPENQKRKVYLK